MKNNTVTPIKCARCAVFCALIIVGAYIRIPLPPVPFTLQSFFVILSGLILGAGYGAASVGLYIFMGLLGLPVFTGGGGLASVFTPTFGYIIGFFFAAYVAGLIASDSVKFSRLLAASLAATVVVYIFGMGYYYLMQTLYFDKSVEIKQFLISFGAMTAPKDILLCPILAIAAKRLNLALRKYGK